MPVSEEENIRWVSICFSNVQLKDCYADISPPSEAQVVPVHQWSSAVVLGERGNKCPCVAASEYLLPGLSGIAVLFFCALSPSDQWADFMHLFRSLLFWAENVFLVSFYIKREFHSQCNFNRWYVGNFTGL